MAPIWREATKYTIASNMAQTIQPTRQYGAAALLYRPYTGCGFRIAAICATQSAGLWPSVYQSNIGKPGKARNCAVFSLSLGVFQNRRGTQSGTFAEHPIFLGGAARGVVRLFKKNFGGRYRLKRRTSAHSSAQYFQSYANSMFSDVSSNRKFTFSAQRRRS